MSLASIIHLPDRTCPRCGKTVPHRIQFKYGDTRLREYHVGEALFWGGNDVGEEGHDTVSVSGFAEPCDECAYHDETLYGVTIQNNIITDVRAVGGLSEEVARFGPEGHLIKDAS